MMRVWSSRPRWSHLGLFFAAYLLGCGFAELIGIVPGTNIAIWPPGGVFLATLIMTQRRTWLWWTLAGCLAEMLAQLIWYHSPLLAGFIMYLGNALCAVVGASLVTRANGGRPVRLESLQEVLAFVVLGAGIAPIFSATVGAVTLDFFDVRSQTFVEAWPLWWIGDATGILLVAPLTLGILQNRPSATKLTAARWAEAGVLALVFLGVAALSLSGYLPYAYIIMPPLLWAAVRFEFRGAVIALTILALIATLFTISGAGQFAGDAATQRDKQIMLQLFLAISAFSALIVATISGQ
jgi:integral membrane sensor domain MASE1